MTEPLTPPPCEYGHFINADGYCRSCGSYFGMPADMRPVPLNDDDEDFWDDDAA